MIQGNREKVKGVVLASPVKLIVLVIGLYLLFVFSRGIWEIRQAYLRLDEAKKGLALEQKKRDDLRQKQAEMATPDFIEKMARNELNMQKDGELVVVLPTETGQKPVQNQVQTEDQGEIPNFLKWWRLIR